MSWQDSLFLDGTNIDADLRDLVTSIVLTRTMEGAESLDITIRDEAMDFLVSGVLARPGNAPYTVSKQLKEAAWDRFGRALLTLDGVFFRLAGVQGNYAAPPWTLTLTFESEIATLMRQKTRAVKSSRNQSTRAQFIHYLAALSQRSDLAEHGLPTFATVTPDIEKRDPQAKPKDADRSKGLSKSAHLTINGFPITSEQRRNLTISLTEADRHHATETVYLSMLVAGIGESSFTAIPNQDGSDYGGVFQGKFKGENPQFKLGDTKGMADSFLLGGRGFQAGGAIKLSARQPTLTPGQIAYMVEGDLSNFQGDTARAAAFYQGHITEAQNLLAAWGGATKTLTVHESYEYKAGGPKAGGGHEDYWAATERLASEVRWRRFASANWLYFGPDEFFFQNQPSFVIDSTAGSNPPTNRGKQGLADQGVLSLGFTADVGMPASEVNVTVLAPAWTTSPGATFQFDYMGPLTGRWLIWQSKQDLTLDIDRADLILRAPAPQKKEPAATTRKRTEQTPQAGSARDLIVAAAKKALKYVPQYRYLQSRPFPDHLYPNSVEILRMDCSAFATLVYKAAGVPDPNGVTYNYSGFGNTQTLMAGGTRTASPQPGDLIFYRSPEHVGVYIGDGKVIELGGTPGPLELNVNYRKDKIGYFTYDLTKRA